MQRFILILLFFVTLLLSTAPVHAETLNIATINLAPWGYAEQGKAKGITYEMSNLIAHEAGYNVTNTLLTVAETLEQMKTGAVDMVIMLPNPQLKKHAINLGMILPVKNIVIGRAETAFHSFKDLRGKRIATIKGSKYDGRLSKSNGIILLPLKNHAQCLKMLLSKQVDGVAGTHSGLFFTAQQNSIPLNSLGKPFTLSIGQVSLFLSTQTATPERKQRIIESMRQASMRGQIQSIWGKYLF